MMERENVIKTITNRQEAKRKYDNGVTNEYDSDILILLKFMEEDRAEIAQLSINISELEEKLAKAMMNGDD